MFQEFLPEFFQVLIPELFQWFLQELSQLPLLAFYHKIHRASGPGIRPKITPEIFLELYQGFPQL